MALSADGITLRKGLLFNPRTGEILGSAYEQPDLIKAEIEAMNDADLSTASPPPSSTTKGSSKEAAATTRASTSNYPLASDLVEFRATSIGGTEVEFSVAQYAVTRVTAGCHQGVVLALESNGMRVGVINMDGASENRAWQQKVLNVSYSDAVKGCRGPNSILPPYVPIPPPGSPAHPMNYQCVGCFKVAVINPARPSAIIAATSDPPHITKKLNTRLDPRDIQPG